MRLDNSPDHPFIVQARVLGGNDLMQISEILMVRRKNLTIRILFSMVGISFSLAGMAGMMALACACIYSE